MIKQTILSWKERIITRKTGVATMRMIERERKKKRGNFISFFDFHKWLLKPSTTPSLDSLTRPLHFLQSFVFRKRTSAVVDILLMIAHFDDNRNSIMITSGILQIPFAKFVIYRQKQLFFLYNFLSEINSMTYDYKNYFFTNWLKFLVYLY